MSQVLQDIRDNFSGIKKIDRDDLLKELNVIKTKRECLFNCEVDAIHLLDKRKYEILDELDTLEDYPKLDNSFFEQTVTMGECIVPKFSFIHIGRTECNLEIIKEKEKLFTPPNLYIDTNYPKCLKNKVLEIAQTKVSNKGVFSFLFVLYRIWPVLVLAIAAPTFLSVFFQPVDYIFPLFFFGGFGLVISLIGIVKLYIAGDTEVTVNITDSFVDSLGKAVIPDGVRQTIYNEQDNFDSMWLMKEANWDVKIKNKVVVQRKDPDPLLVGIKNQKMYVLDCFDLTPAEEYIKREFATKE